MMILSNLVNSIKENFMGFLLCKYYINYLFSEILILDPWLASESVHNYVNEIIQIDHWFDLGIKWLVETQVALLCIFEYCRQWHIDLL